MRKPATIVLITFLLLITIGISILFVMVLNGSIKINGFKFNFQSSYIKEVAVDEIYDNTFDSIKIRTTAGDINIYESEDESIKLIINNKAERTTVTTDGILDINLKTKKCNFVCINPRIAKVDLYIPKNYDKEIVIDTDYGDIDVASFENANFDINSNYGDIKIKGANKVKADLDYGDIEIDTVNELIIENNFGDVEVNTINDYIDISCDYGDIELKTVNLTRDSNISDDFGDVEIKHIKGIRVEAKTSLGDTDVNGSDSSSNIKLTIKVDCGDIEVN